MIYVHVVVSVSPPRRSAPSRCFFSDPLPNSFYLAANRVNLQPSGKGRKVGDSGVVSGIASAVQVVIVLLLW